MSKPPWGWHWEYGWLRRPELDASDPVRYAYERPDGAIAYTSLPEHREMAHLIVENSLSLSTEAKFARDKAILR